MKKIWIITIFPEYFGPFLEQGITGTTLSGQKSLNVKVEVVNLRDFSHNKYGAVDDSPYGGGPGMVMRADVLANSIQGILSQGGYADKSDLHIVYTSPRGKVWSAKNCREFASHSLSEDSKDLVFICGRYEGIDERFIELYVNEQISLGDYVLTGGELAVMTILDSAVRYIPGVLGNSESANEDSFESSLLEHPQYTKPAEVEGKAVPEILTSGHHKKIEEYRQNERLRITKENRKDLLKENK